LLMRVAQAVSVLWNCMAYFNSCVNPIIYNTTSKEFRDAFIDACRCRGAAAAADRSNWTELRVVVDERRVVSLVTRLTQDKRRYASYATTCSVSLSPSPDSVQRSAVVSPEHLSVSASSPSSITTRQVRVEPCKSNTLLTVPALADTSPHLESTWTTTGQ